MKYIDKVLFRSAYTNEVIFGEFLLAKETGVDVIVNDEKIQYVPNELIVEYIEKETSDIPDMSFDSFGEYVDTLVF